MTAAMSDAVQLLAYRRWLAGEADWIASGTQATDLGRRARRAYLDRNQIRNLQRVAETSVSASDLTDYVKTQIGKHGQWRREDFGPALLEELNRLRARTSDQTGAPATGGSGRHLDLCRLYLRQMAAAYLYFIAVDATAARAAPAARVERPAPRQERAPARPEPAERPPRQRRERQERPSTPLETSAEPAAGEPAGGVAAPPTEHAEPESAPVAESSAETTVKAGATRGGGDAEAAIAGPGGTPGQATGGLRSLSFGEGRPEDGDTAVEERAAPSDESRPEEVAATISEVMPSREDATESPRSDATGTAEHGEGAADSAITPTRESEPAQ